MPLEVEKLGVEVTSNIEEALESADVVNVLRMQLERQGSALFPTLREYAKCFCITRERLSAAKEDVLVMHPGPMNRGVEIAQDVADGPFSVILEQVSNGVAVRMAVLYLLSGLEVSDKLE
jgi:aspartate carbamoyltransferase catalytic subunit